MGTNVDETILTIQSLAEYLHIEGKTVCRMAQGTGLLGFKVRRPWRFTRSDIDLWIEAEKSIAATIRFAPRLIRTHFLDGGGPQWTGSRVPSSLQPAA